jgi:tetratricopeptide (TPR) repeat protein/NAD-dependent SIR2 family protein deacetylase
VNARSDGLQSPEDLITAISTAIDQQQLAVWCGAGISRHSGIPTVIDFKGEVLRLLGASDDVRDALLESNHPFEAFVETLQTCDPTGHLYNVYTLGRPNATHTLLAKLVKMSKLHTIVTTNFDTLLEQALAAERMKAGKHYDLFADESAFETINWHSMKPRVIKIHGTVDSPDSIATTIRQVSAQRLSRQRRTVVDHMFSGGAHTSVLILGYSASDVFDINPQIESIDRAHKRVIFVEHGSEPRVEDLSHRPKRNPFRRFPSSERLTYDTDQLIRTLWSAYVRSPYRQTTHIGRWLWWGTVDHAPWRENLELWYETALRTHSQAFRFDTIGHLLLAVGSVDKAIGYFQSALECARGIGDPAREALALGAIGATFALEGDYATALSYHEQALTLARTVRATENRDRYLPGHAHIDNGSVLLEGAFAAIGADYHGAGDYAKALSYHTEALNLARSGSPPRRGAKGLHLGHLGGVYADMGDPLKAMEYYEAALTIAREEGDKSSECIHLHNIGNAHRKLNQLDEAVKCLSEAHRIVVELGDRGTEASIAAAFAGALASSGELSHAHVRLLEAFLTRVTDKTVRKDMRAKLGLLDEQEN